MNQYFMYIATNKLDTVLYIGVTNNLVQRMYEHKQKLVSGFSAKYNITKLVYFEVLDDVRIAIAREKQLKAGSRKKKLELIEKTNPTYKDLYASIL